MRFGPSRGAESLRRLYGFGVEVAGDVVGVGGIFVEPAAAPATKPWLSLRSLPEQEEWLVTTRPSADVACGFGGCGAVLGPAEAAGTGLVDSALTGASEKRSG